MDAKERIYSQVYDEAYFKIFDEYYPKVERVKKITDLNTLQAVIRNVSTVFQESPWYRGHPKAGYGLVAPVFRGSVDFDSYFTERDKIAHWLRFAQVRCQSPPEKDDYVGWLYLMRHHGLETRLLDWTTSVLNALFFTLSDLDNDGELFMLSPGHLNYRTTGTFGVQQETSQAVQSLAKAPITGKLPEVIYDIPKKTSRVTLPAVCFYPKENNLRMLVQQSVFSIHGDNRAINNLPQTEFFLHRFIIPKDAKEEFLRFICISCGITEEKLFPDLDHLSKIINNTVFSEVRSKWLPDL